MARFAKAALFGLAALAGCATYETTPQAPVLSSSGTPVLSASGTPVTSAAPATPARVAARPGFGVVESVSLVNPPSASTGAPMTVSAPYRLTVRMDDASVQWIDVNDRDFRVGDRVELTGDGRIIKR
jgi:hypothetical protein